MSDNLFDGEGDVVLLSTGVGIIAAITVPLSTQDIGFISRHLPYSGVGATPELSVLGTSSKKYGKLFPFKKKCGKF